MVISTQSSIADIMAGVQRVCIQKKLRLTTVRREALELLLNEKKPCKAYTLLEHLQQNNNQPTAIYRALHFLLQHGFAHKIHSQNAYVPCRHPEDSHDCYFLICERCGDVDECCNKKASRVIVDTAQNKQFNSTRAFLEIFGECKKCLNR